LCDIEGVMKYYVHYNGWNSRYDEWIDGIHIAYKKKCPEPGPEEDNDANFQKSSPPEVCIIFRKTFFRKWSK